MKEVFNEKGEVISVSKDTPCYPAENGVLPRLYTEQEWIEVSEIIRIRELEYQNTAEARNLERIRAKRKREYGSPESQLEMIGKEGLDVWKAHLEKVRTDNPLPIIELVEEV